MPETCCGLVDGLHRYCGLNDRHVHRVVGIMISLLKVIIWTAILTGWVFGSIVCGMKGAYHFDQADRSSDKEHWKQAAIWWGSCVAIASSAVVSMIVWLVSLP